MSALAVEKQGNVLIPKVFDWIGDVQKANFLRLLENPTHEQLAILRRNLTPYYNDFTFPLDNFCFLFAMFLDRLPETLPPMTEQQLYALYGQGIRDCLDLGTKWTSELTSWLKEHQTISV